MFSAANEIHLASGSGPLNAGVAEDLAPHPHPALAAGVVRAQRAAATSSRWWSRMRRMISSGRSMLARCDASGTTTKRAGDGVRDGPAVLGRSGEVVRGGYDERRGLHGLKPVAQVHVPDGGAATGVALGVRRT